MWDGRSETPHLARDAFGIKPLFYLPAVDGFWLASESKALLAVRAFFSIESLLPLMMSELPAMQSRTVRSVVAYRDPDLAYPPTAPFDPDCAYPEYPFGSRMIHPENRVYAAVRRVLRDAGLDARRFGTPAWNPLADLAPQGGKVMIKPNWVRHYHLRDEDVFSLITHPSVLRPLIDYAFKAVGPSGSVWVMDAPLFDTDFSVIRRICQLDALESEMRARGVPLTIADLRSLVVRIEDGVVVDRRHQKEWSTEGIEFDLEQHSELAELNVHLCRVFGSDYDRRLTVSHHRVLSDNQQCHRYRISKRAIEANLVISVPKLKTHKKTGVTLNIKNMIGINTDKNYIPHYRVGAPVQGGDEFPDTTSAFRRFRRAMVRAGVDRFLGPMGQYSERPAHVFMKTWLGLNRGRAERKAGHRLDPIDVFYRTAQGDIYRTGNWWGNDTCWRCGLDINKILFYGKLDGGFAVRPMRTYFSVIDGIVGGDEDGPLAPRPRAEGVLLGGFDPVSVDVVSSQVMGFDPECLRDQARAMKLVDFPLTDSKLPIEVVSNRPEWQGRITPGSDLNFEPHYGWREYLKSST